MSCPYIPAISLKCLYLLLEATPSVLLRLLASLVISSSLSSRVPEKLVCQTEIAVLFNGHIGLLVGVFDILWRK